MFLASLEMSSCVYFFVWPDFVCFLAPGDTSQIAPGPKMAVLRHFDAILGNAWGNSEINLTHFYDVFSIIGDIFICIFLCLA